jgi:hypothetical protein
MIYVFEIPGRSERIRTSDPLVPNEVRYWQSIEYKGILVCFVVGFLPLFGVV